MRLQTSFTLVLLVGPLGPVRHVAAEADDGFGVACVPSSKETGAFAVAPRLSTCVYLPALASDGVIWGIWLNSASICCRMCGLGAEVGAFRLASAASFSRYSPNHPYPSLESLCIALVLYCTWLCSVSLSAALRKFRLWELPASVNPYLLGRRRP